MHNNIMATSLRDRPLMLATGRYAQWQSHFLRYINTIPNGDALRKCILEGPYTPSIVTILVIPTTDEPPEVPERTAVKTILNMSPENKAHYESVKKAIHLLLTGIRDEIYTTFNACKTAHEMWIVIERIQQESYYSRFYKMMNEMYQKEVNEIHVERIAKNANPLALVAATQQYRDPYYQAPKPHRSFAPPSKQSSSTRSNATTKYKGKEIAKPITPPSESASEEDRMQETKKGKDYSYHKEKMLLCKQVKKGVPLQVEQADWLADTDEEIDEQELEAHYSYMAKIQERYHYVQPESISNTCVVKKVDSNVIPDSPDMCDNDIPINQNADECDDEHGALANLIANLKLDVDENKKIQKQLKKENASLNQELNDCKSILAETTRTLGESNSTRDSCLIALQSKPD
ncbi:hypothetical protein Tco_1343679 [Tanacetum coccineum]